MTIEYLTTEELALRIKYDPRTIRERTGEVCHEAKVAAEIDVIVACLRRFSDEIK